MKRIYLVILTVSLITSAFCQNTPHILNNNTKVYKDSVSSTIKIRTTNSIIAGDSTYAPTISGTNIKSSSFVTGQIPYPASTKILTSTNKFMWFTSSDSLYVNGKINSSGNIATSNYLISNQLTSGQIAFPNSSKQLIGTTKLTWDNSNFNLGVTGKIGIYSSNFIHNLSVVGSTTNGNNMFNLVNSDKNKVRTSLAQATDTSSISIIYTTSGKPIIKSTTYNGDTLWVCDTTGKITFWDDFEYKRRHVIASTNGTYTPALTQNVPLKITPGMTSIDAVDMTFAGDTVTLSSSVKGDYELEMFGSIASALNDDFVIYLRVNNVNVTTSYWEGSTSGTGNQVGIYYKWYLYNMTGGEKLSLWITNTTNNNDPVIGRFKIFCEKKTDKK